MSKDGYDETLSAIETSWQQFHAYLVKNRLDHEALFAGYARRGVQTFDNHTNNRLERFHITIKSVVSSSQVTVGTLIDKLAKITTVRSVATAHQAFDQQFNCYWRESVKPL